MVAAGASRDEAAAVRPGEALDVERLDAWLKARVPELSGTPRITQYRGGASNWTYRLEYEGRDLILRRPPAGTKARSAHDMGREFRIQQALRPVYPYVPRMLAHCADEAVVGAEFYVMERLDGLILRRDLPPGVTLTPRLAGELCRRALDVLIALHRVDVEAAGLAWIGKGAGYVRRQVEGWSERYRKARTWNVPRGERIMAWLSAHLPARERLCVTHNDFRFDNLVLDRQDPTRILGVLDWELATLGDPWMDLGNALAYWVERDDDFFGRAIRRQPTHLPGMLTRHEVVDYYAERTGERPESFTFYEVFGLFRLAVIAQQIYFRYHRRETRNPAYRRFWLFVHYLHRRCAKALRRSSD
ncbi:MAG: phosphotransferase family protein [Acidobacteriota bacterium]